MADRILVGTRKGLFVYRRAPGPLNAWRSEAPAFIGVPVSMTLHDERDGALYAALAHGHFGVKLHRSDDGGANWSELAAPVYPAAPPGDAPAPALEYLWALEAGGTDAKNEIWAGTVPGGLFRSTDRGESWTLNEALWTMPERAQWFGGGFGKPGIHSICIDPRNSRHLLVAVSCGGVWGTTDGGKSWASRAAGMWAEYVPPEQRDNPCIQDPHRMVRCRAKPDVLWAQHHNGVFRTSDNGETWREIAPVPPSNFGFAAAADPKDGEVAWLVPAIDDACRVPVDGRLVVSRTTDGGRSFRVISEGLPAASYDLVYRHGLDIDEDGARLAMGSTTGALWVSEDRGDSWTCVSAHLPPILCVRFA